MEDTIRRAVVLVGPDDDVVKEVFLAKAAEGAKALTVADVSINEQITRRSDAMMFIAIGRGFCD
jgi:hypothetical protein